MGTEDPPDTEEEAEPTVEQGIQEETPEEEPDEQEGNGDEPEEQEVEPAPTEAIAEQRDERSPSDQWETFATYSIRENGVTYKIIPQFTSTETRWTLWIFGSGQGPIQRPNGISDEVAAHLGLSRQTQHVLNATLKRAQEEMELPTEFRGQPRRKRSLSELKETLDVDG